MSGPLRIDTSLLAVFGQHHEPAGSPKGAPLSSDTALGLQHQAAITSSAVRHDNGHDPLLLQLAQLKQQGHIDIEGQHVEEAEIKVGSREVKCNVNASA